MNYKWRLLFWITLVLIFALPPLFRQDERSVRYRAPRFPAEILAQPADEDLQRIAGFIANQISGRTRLGLIQPGQKLLIITDRSQDMRLLDAVIEAMKRRQVEEVDYIFRDELLEQTLGIRETGNAAPPRPRRIEDGWEAPWIRFLPDSLRHELETTRGSSDRLYAGRASAVNEAIRRYVMELHPEYDAVVGAGGGRQVYIKMQVGGKWKSLWDYTNMQVAVVRAATYPPDVWRLTEEKIMQTIPWIEEAHITDPEGTDLRFSVNAEEAEIWAKGAYQPNHLFLYPLQGSRAVYWREGITKVVVPKANGVVVATHGNSGVFPAMKVYIKDSMVTHVEGGGRYKEVWDAYLANEKLSNAEIPLLPNKGFFYLYEISWGANPKTVRMYDEPSVQDNGRAGSFHWGFGVELGNPEIDEYVREHGLPNDHGMHMKTYFTTYRVRVRGTNQWINFVDRGRLYHLDDPEVRALASSYGNADEILKERFVPEIPGINVPGDYEEYAKDPASYFYRLKELVDEGTYPYLQ